MLQDPARLRNTGSKFAEKKVERMDPILKQISNVGIMPVIAIDDAKKAVPLAKALVAGGLPVAEVTFRTACSGGGNAGDRSGSARDAGGRGHCPDP